MHLSYTVCTVVHVHVEVPYSGKLSREKTFADFAVLWLFAKVFSVKFGGMASFGAAKANNPRKFSPWKSYFHQSAKVFRYTVSMVPPFPEGINWSLHLIRTVDNEATKYHRERKLSHEKTFANWWKIRFFCREMDCSLVLSKDATPPNFMNSNKISKFTQVFSLKSFPLVSLHVLSETVESASRAVKDPSYSCLLIARFPSRMGYLIGNCS